MAGEQEYRYLESSMRQEFRTVFGQIQDLFDSVTVKEGKAGWCRSDGHGEMQAQE